jgi:ribosomal RNA-processing protein 9
MQVSTDAAQDEKRLQQISRIPIYGYVNGIVIGPEGRFSIAAVGQEPRLGRWDRVPSSKNRIVLIHHKINT